MGGMVEACVEEFSPKIFVLFRRYGHLTTDPSNGETAMLHMLQRKYCLAYILVVTPADANVVAPKGDQWAKAAGDIHVQFVRMAVTRVEDAEGTPTFEFLKHTSEKAGIPADSVDVAIFCRQLSNAVQDAPSQIAHRERNAQQNFSAQKNKVLGKLGIYKRAKETEIDPWEFQKFMALHPLKCENLGLPQMDPWELPREQFLLDNFRKRIQTKLNNTQVARLDELAMRSFLFKACFAHILSAMDTFAEHFYETVARPLKQEVADKWLEMDLAQFQEEIDQTAENCEVLNRDRQNIADPEMIAEMEHDRESLKIVSEFLKKESFISMYVGSTALSVVPILYGIIYPCFLHESAGDAIHGANTPPQNRPESNPSVGQNISRPETRNSRFTDRDFTSSIAKAVAFYEDKANAFALDEEGFAE